MVAEQVMRRLPAVRVPASADLLAEALEAPLFRQVEAVARQGLGADLTKAGLLRAKDARAVAAAVGLTAGSATAPGSPVQRCWGYAVSMELVVVEREGGRTTAAEGPGLRVLDAAARGEADDEELLHAWLDLFLAVTDDPIRVAALLTLYLSGPDPVTDMARAVQGSPLWPAELLASLGPIAELAVAGMLEQSLGELESAGAVRRDQAGVRLTGLGTYGANELFRIGGFDASAVGDDPGGAIAAELIDLLLETEDADEQKTLFAAWLVTREPADAARELVEAAADGGPCDRMVAFALLMELDPGPSEPAVRAALADPTLRHYATGWLLSNGLDGPASTVEMAVWLTIDGITAGLDASIGDEEVVRDVLASRLAAIGPESEQVELVARMPVSDHPDAGEVLELLRAHHPSRRIARAAGAPVDAAPARERRAAKAYQLKITLRGVRPPVWRSVVVSGSMTLGGVHSVIREAMGWMGGHLHDFEVDGERYGGPELDDEWGDPVIPEDRTRLDTVAGEGTKLRYTYDFGDDWRHDVVVEKVRAVEPGERLPVCLAGRRCCPPEDVGGPWGYAEFLEAFRDPAHPSHETSREWAPDFDPAEFDRDEVTAALQRMCSGWHLP